MASHVGYSLVQNVCCRHRPGSGAEDDFPDHGTKTAFELPIRTDLLGSHLKGPWLSLTAAELADRGLLPGGTRYAPEQKKVDITAHEVGTPRPIWAAAARAAELRRQHVTLRKIAA